MRNKLMLGTVQLGLDYGVNNSSGKMSVEVAGDVLDLAYASGIRMLDTAASYGDSERRIGSYLETNPGNMFSIVTKFSTQCAVSPLESLERSLQNLNVPQVDTLMFHSFRDFRQTSEADLQLLAEQKGVLFLKLGVSIYTNDEAVEVCDTDIFDVVQIPFNALDNDGLRGETLQRLKECNLETHTRSVFLQGLFFMGPSAIPAKLRPLIPFLERLEQIALKFGVPKAALALQYAGSKSYIDRVLVGVDTPAQLQYNLALLDAGVPDEALGEVDRIIVDHPDFLNPAVWNL